MPICPQLCALTVLTAHENFSSSSKGMGSLFKKLKPDFLQLLASKVSEPAFNTGFPPQWFLQTQCIHQCIPVISLAIVCAAYYWGGGRSWSEGLEVIRDFLLAPWSPMSFLEPDGFLMLLYQLWIRIGLCMCFDLKTQTATMKIPLITCLRLVLNALLPHRCMA